MGQRRAARRVLQEGETAKADVEGLQRSMAATVERHPSRMGEVEGQRVERLLAVWRVGPAAVAEEVAATPDETVSAASKDRGAIETGKEGAVA